DAVLADVFGALRARLEVALLGEGAFATRIERAVSAWIDAGAERPALARLLLRAVADGTPARSSRLAPHLPPFFAPVDRALAASGAAAHRIGVGPAAVASSIAGGAVSFAAAMPRLLPDGSSAPLEPARRAALRRELLGTVHRLLLSG